MEPQTGTSVFVLIRGTLLQGLKVTKSNGCTYWTWTSRWGFFLFFYSRNKLGSLPSPGALPSDRGPSVSELCVVLFLFSFPKSHWLRLCGAAGRGAGPPHMMLHFILPTLSDSGTSPACQWTSQKTKTGPPWVRVLQNIFTWALFAKLTQQIQETLHVSLRVSCISSLTVYPAVLKAQFLEFYTESKTIALFIRSFMYIYKWEPF